MPPIRIGDREVEVNLELTRRIHEQLSPYGDWCPCSDCTFARMARRFYLPEQRALLDQLGMSILTAYMAGSSFAESKRGRFDVVYDCYILSANADESVFGTSRIGPDTWIGIESGEGHRLRAPFPLDKSERASLHLLTFVRRALPWQESLAGGLRQATIEGPCPACGFRCRETAYLKRKGSIPEMYGRPELRVDLRRKETRVLAILCPFCGELDTRIVSKRPYR